MNPVKILFLGEAAGAVAAAKETDAAIAGVGRTSAVTNAETGKLERGILAGSGAFRGLGRSVGLASAAFIGAAGLTEAVKGSIDEAEKLEKAQRSLDAAIVHTGGNVAKQRPEYDATAKAAAQYGVSQADATQELARAVLLTGDSTKAQRAYQQALLISKATGKDFNSVLTATAKAQDGSATSLTRYGIMLPKVTTAQDALKATNAHATAAEIAHAKAVDATSQALQTSRVIMQRFGGQAAANTTNMDRLRANVANLGAQLGGPLLGALNVVAGALSGLIGWLQQNQAILKPIAEFIGIVTAAWLAYVAVAVGVPAVIEAATAAQVALDAAMDANPIGLVVIAIAALVAGFIIAWQHSKTFRDVVIGTWHAIRDAAVAVFGAIVTVVTGAWDRIRGATTAVLNFLKEHWRAAVVALATILLGPLGTIIALIITHWGQVKSITASAWNAVHGIVSSAVNGIRSVVSSVFGTLVGIVRKAANGVSAAAGAIRSAFSPIISILDQIIQLAGQAMGAISRIKGAGGSILHSVANAVTGGAASLIPGHAAGIINSPGGLAIVGEHGPELVTLPRGSSVYSAAQTRRMVSGGSPVAGGSPGGDYAPFRGANLYLLGTTPRAVAGELAKLIAGAPVTPSIAVVAR